MGQFLKELENLLPGYLNEICSRDYIPFMHVKDRHEDLSVTHLTALFEAYQRLDQALDVETLATRTISEDSWGCMRCGFCCTFMRPGPVKASTYRSWMDADAPIAWFYSARREKSRNGVYRCWYHNGVRLRMCPFMFINLRDFRPFCSIYHMGDDLRPPVCSGFIPKHETCGQHRWLIEPWECN